MYNNSRSKTAVYTIMLYVYNEKDELYRNIAKILQRDSVPSNNQVSVG
jgi:hypothetical protein